MSAIIRISSSRINSFSPFADVIAVFRQSRCTSLCF